MSKEFLVLHVPLHFLPVQILYSLEELKLTEEVFLVDMRLLSVSNTSINE